MSLSIESRCIHLEDDDRAARYGAVSFPIYQTATFAHPALGLGDALQLHPLGAGGLMGQLIGLPQLVQQGFLLQGGGGLPLF